MNKRQSKTMKRITNMFGERKVQTEFQTKKQGLMKYLPRSSFGAFQIPLSAHQRDLYNPRPSRAQVLWLLRPVFSGILLMQSICKRSCEFTSRPNKLKSNHIILTTSTGH